MPNTDYIITDTLYLHDDEVSQSTEVYALTLYDVISISDELLIDAASNVTLDINDIITLDDTQAGLAGTIELVVFAKILTIHNGQGGGVYQYGDVIDISANVNSNEIFTQWVGDIASVEEPYQADTRVVMIDNITLTALVTIVKGDKMKTAYQDLTMNQGATFLLRLLWKDSEGAIANLTGYTARMKLKESKGGTLIDSYVSGSEITLGGTTGLITISVLASVTEGYSFRRAYYDLELVSGTTVIRLLEGKIILSTEVTD